ncbi:hypothetical protein [Streptomyces sp. NPDC047024]|uniref:hypothetical protein n=1 Tax=Streptomyces sp. NPDC047024 TaxID=3155476 RepID=UPI0033E78519
MADLTGNSPDGCLEPRPDQIADVPLIELLDDSVDLTPRSRLRARHRDYPVEYATLRKVLEDEVRRLAAPCPRSRKACARSTSRAGGVPTSPAGAWPQGPLTLESDDGGNPGQLRPTETGRGLAAPLHEALVHRVGANGLDFDDIVIADAESESAADLTAATLRMAYYVMITRARRRLALGRRGVGCPRIRRGLRGRVESR